MYSAMVAYWLLERPVIILVICERWLDSLLETQIWSLMHPLFSIHSYGAQSTASEALMRQVRCIGSEHIMATNRKEADR